jgi:hypothetical protein
MKNKLTVNNRVQFKNTSSVVLDGKFGKILGIASRHAEFDMWIVLLDEPLVDCLAVVISEFSLNPTI